MFCVFISNCEDKSILKTRSILDRYATRIGQFAWHTRITEEALEALYLALRRSATRKTSVACYRNMTRDSMKLLWIVGNHMSYDKYGRFSVGIKNVKKEMPTAFRHAALLTRISGLSHDLGKANERFQEKIGNSNDNNNILFQGDAIRHEWLSVFLIKEIFKKKQDFDVNALYEAWEFLSKSKVFDTGEIPVERIDNFFDAFLITVATHHGLFAKNLTTIGSGAHVKKDGKYDYYKTKKMLLTPKHQIGDLHGEDLKRWKNILSAIETNFKRLSLINKNGRYWEGIMLIARAALILADHDISSQEYKWENEKYNPEKIPMANSLKGGNGRLNQPLSWHLQSVAEQASKNIRMFMGDDLPHIDRDFCKKIISEEALPNSRFKWQDEAVSFLKDKNEQSLVFNVASTGSGKTLANLKMGIALRNDKNSRLSFAFNLRTLTKQTFKAFEKHVKNKKVFEKDFAILIGEKAISPEFAEEDEIQDDVYGLNDFLTEIEGYESNKTPEWLTKLSNKNNKMLKLIASPVLVSTVDYLVAAGEPGKQAHHAKAMIRVATSDLILDEVDSYSIESMVSLLRLIQISAMFGRNVIISSATLSPELVEAITIAFQSGHEVKKAMFGEEKFNIITVSDLMPPNIIDVTDAKNEYIKYMKEFSNKISENKITKKFKIVDFSDRQFFKNIFDLHDMNHTSIGDLNISLGLFRIANVKNCINISNLLLKNKDEKYEIRVSCYHAKDINLRRYEKEKLLDKCLDRTHFDKENSNWIKNLYETMPWLKNKKGNVILVLVASPVEEVGRDHDFDWAIIEPSSIHSIIQTSGRVNRHRLEQIDENKYNIIIMKNNFKSLFDKKESVVFQFPGLQNRNTNHNPSMNIMMKPSDKNIKPSEIIDSRLIFDFDEKRVRFAEDDDYAIKLYLKNNIKILERSDNSGLLFMTKEFEKNKLRNETYNKIKVDILIGKPDENGFYLIEDNWKKSKNKLRKKGDVVWENEPTNQWLELDIKKLSELNKIDLDCSIELNKKDNLIDYPKTINISWNGVLLDKK